MKMKPVVVPTVDAGGQDERTMAFAKRIGRARIGLSAGSIWETKQEAKETRV